MYVHVCVQSGDPHGLLPTCRLSIHLLMGWMDGWIGICDELFAGEKGPGGGKDKI